MNGDLLITPSPAPPPPPPPEPPPAEEAGTRALEDALRSSFFIIKIIMIGLVVVFLSSGFFTVEPQHKAIKLRFGKPVGEGASALLGPGLHLAWPSPIEQEVFIPFTSVQTANSTIGWYQSEEDRAKGVEAIPGGNSLSPANSSYALTADTNIIHVHATVRYTITDPIRFHFDFVDAPIFITNALNAALLTAARQFKVDDILTLHKDRFHEAVGRRLHDLIDTEELGVTIEQPDVQEAPPLFLKDKFDEVVQTTQRARETMQKASAYAEQTEAVARGEASAITNRAEADRSTLVKTVAAQSEAFNKYLPLYAQNPGFFEEFRTMQ